MTTATPSRACISAMPQQWRFCSSPAKCCWVKPALRCTRCKAAVPYHPRREARRRRVALQRLERALRDVSAYIDLQLQQQQ